MAINAEAAEGTFGEATLGACRAVQLLQELLAPRDLYRTGRSGTRARTCARGGSICSAFQNRGGNHYRPQNIRTSPAPGKQGAEGSTPTSVKHRRPGKQTRAKYKIYQVFALSILPPPPKHQQVARISSIKPTARSKIGCRSFASTNHE